jgi:hypothetical protein
VIASRPPSIRVLFGTLLALVMLLAAGLFSVTILQRDTAPGAPTPSTSA